MPVGQAHQKHSDETSRFGIVREIGWDEMEDGTPTFRAIVDFPNGPPGLGWDVVWQAIPVDIVPRAPSPPQAHGGE